MTPHRVIFLQMENEIFVKKKTKNKRKLCVYIYGWFKSIRLETLLEISNNNPFYKLNMNTYNYSTEYNTFIV